MRRARPVTLSPEEREVLYRRARAGARSGLVAQRALVVLRASEGLRDIDIARETGLHRLTVARWRARFLVGRMQGLEDALGASRGYRIPADQVAAIARTTLGRSAPGGRRWSTRALAREFGVSHMTVRRVWEAHRIRPRRFGTLPQRADPVRPSRIADVVGLLLDPPLAAVAFTRHRTIGDPARTGAVATAPRAGPADVSPSGTETTPAWATDPPAPPGGRAKSGSGRGVAGHLVNFLAALERNVPREVDMEVDVALPPGGPRGAIEAFRLRHPRVELAWSSDLRRWYGSALERIAEAGVRPVPRGQFHGPGETARSLARFLLDYDPSAGSYRWVATAAEVARGEAAYRLRYELAVTGHVGFKKHGPLEGPVGPAGIDEPKARAMARSLLRHYLKLHRGERLTVETWTETLGYANAIALESLRLGARPLVLYQDEPTYWAATTEVPARNLAALGEHRRAALERTDAFVSFFGPSDRERFHALPPTTLFRLSAYEDALYQAAAKGRARAVQMAIGRVSAASARMYGVDEAVWREELVAAALVPPATLRRRAAPLVAALRRGRELTIRHPNGTELHLRLAGRTPVVSDGSVRRAEDARHWGLVTVPAGVVSVAVDERFAEGQFRSNQPSGVGLSDTVGEMRGAAWTFADGQLRRARYDAGGDLFEQSRARAGGGRDRPASISIGLNEHLDRAPLLEDQALGTVTMHLGGNDYLGGRTPGPWVAWSFLRGATVEVDGAPIVRSGRLPR